MQGIAKEEKHNIIQNYTPIDIATGMLIELQGKYDTN